jgi:hypothetical protein
MQDEGVVATERRYGFLELVLWPYLRQSAVSLSSSSLFRG